MTFLVTFPLHILAFLECRRDLKPPDPLFAASCLPRSQIAAGMKLQKEENLSNLVPFSAIKI